VQLVSIVAGVRSRGFTADDVADAREVLEHARRNLDRAIRDLETVKKERDEALALIRPLRPRMPDGAAPPSPEEREEIWAKLEELERRAAETGKRIEEDEEETARLIERLQRLRRRLDRYC
jgi:chromosome segregation ATPase